MHKQTVTARDSTTRAMYIFRLAMLCLIAASISACSMLRIGCEFAPWYAAWQLDRYWRLDATQASFAKERIDDLWRWHRRSELPEYARWLRSSSAHLDAPVGLIEVTGWRQTAERLSRFGLTLTDAQRQEATRLTTEYLNSVWQPGDPQRRQALEGVMLASDEITVAVFNTARPEQKARLSERLLWWAADFEALTR